MRRLCHEALSEISAPANEIVFEQGDSCTRTGYLRSKANSREVFSDLYKMFGLKNLGLMIEFRLLVGIGRSGVMIGRFCLNMVS